MSEFSLIDLISRRIASQRADVALGIGDDAALLDVPADRRLVVCTDTLVEGVHFLRGTAPENLGWKSLAVNLSDLAAMGAEPAWALLALTLPDADAGFVERFADGFSELAHLYDVTLVGGDTTQGPLSITVTALGFVPDRAALTRGGACVGDAVFVTGTLGDAAGALRLLKSAMEGPPPRRASRAFAFAPPFPWKGEDKFYSLPQEGRPEAPSAKRCRVAAGGCGVPGSEVQADQAQLLARMHRPEPRIKAGLALHGIASACIDISDGLLADLGHVCEASGVGAEIDVDVLPRSSVLRAAFDDATCRGLALAGGDDYELCFTAPLDRAGEIESVFAGFDLRATRIGRIVAGTGVRVLDADGRTFETPHAGWEHFTQ